MLGSPGARPTSDFLGYGDLDDMDRLACDGDTRDHERAPNECCAPVRVVMYLCFCPTQHNQLAIREGSSQTCCHSLHSRLGLQYLEVRVYFLSLQRRDDDTALLSFVDIHDHGTDRSDPCKAKETHSSRHAISSPECRNVGESAGRSSPFHPVIGSRAKMYLRRTRDLSFPTKLRLICD